MGDLYDFPWRTPAVHDAVRRSPYADSPFFAGYPGSYQPTIRFGMGRGSGGHGGGRGGAGWHGSGGSFWSQSGSSWSRGNPGRAFGGGAWRRFWGGSWWAWGWSPSGWAWSFWPYGCSTWSQPLIAPPSELAAAANGYLQQAGDTVSFDWLDGRTYLATPDGAIRICTT